MGKPRLVILVRHAQSEGNKNRDIHQTVPDHRVNLTPDGHLQALEAGRKLRGLLRPDDTLHFFTSPYKRTRETTEDILTSLTSDEPEPSPFPRHSIKVYEEPRLREQDFGNFQPCSAEMERMWQERADYGHFFYRIPNGESAADAYDRISGFNDSLWRRFEENDFASVCILVTHGLMTRVFLMKWYHFSVEYFEDLRNVNHCEFVVMKRSQESGKFILQNQLRTWTEWRREKAARDSLSAGNSPVPKQRRWGGCPDGCNHVQHSNNNSSSSSSSNNLQQHSHARQIHEATRIPLPKRQDTADLFRDDSITHFSPPKATPSSRPHSALSQSHSLRSISTNRSQEHLHLSLGNTHQTANTNLNTETPFSSTNTNYDERSLPENEDTILDQDPNQPPSSSTSSANVSPSFSTKNLFKQRFPLTMTKAYNNNHHTSISEETSSSDPFTFLPPAGSHTNLQADLEYDPENGTRTPRPPTFLQDQQKQQQYPPQSALGLAIRGQLPHIPPHPHPLAIPMHHTITNPPPTSVEALFPPSATSAHPFDQLALADALGDQSEEDLDDRSQEASARRRMRGNRMMSIQEGVAGDNGKGEDKAGGRSNVMDDVY